MSICFVVKSGSEIRGVYSQYVLAQKQAEAHYCFSQVKHTIHRVEMDQLDWDLIYKVKKDVY